MSAPRRAWLVPEGDPGAAVYGLITVGAVLAVESSRRETYPRTVAAVLVATLLYWLAHAYADLLGERIEHGGRLTPGRLAHCLRAAAPMLAGAAVPIVVVLAAWVFGTSLTTGTWTAVAVCAGLIAAIEVWAGVRAGAEGVELAVEAGTGALLGLMLIGLKILLH